MSRSRVLLFTTLLFAASAQTTFAQATPAPAPETKIPASTDPNVVAPPSPSPTASAAVAPKSALSGHLPIIDLIPEITYANTGSTLGTKGGPLPGIVNGQGNISGTVTIPVIGGLSASYDRVQGNFLNSTFGRIIVDGKAIEPGSLRRRMEVERLDYGFPHSGLGFELGSEFNRFECCLPLEFHDVYLAAKYVTPAIKALHGTKFVFIEKVGTSNHPRPPGADNFDIGKREYGLSNIAVAIVPIDPKFYFTGTYFNGAYDYFEQAPFPFRFNVFIETANFVLNPTVTATLGYTNLTQNEQGAPFPGSVGPSGAFAPDRNTIRFVSIYGQLKFHVDLNKLIR